MADCAFYRTQHWCSTITHPIRQRGDGYGFGTSATNIPRSELHVIAKGRLCAINRLPMLISTGLVEKFDLSLVPIHRKRGALQIAGDAARIGRDDMMNRPGGDET